MLLEFFHYHAATGGFTIKQLSANPVYFQTFFSSLVLSMYHHYAMTCMQGAPSYVTDCFLPFNPCSAYERKTSIGFKPLTPPSTPVSPCRSTNTHTMHEQTPPLVHNSTLGQHSLHGQPAVTNSALSQRALPLHSQTPPFAIPCPPQNHNAHFNNEHRWVSAVYGSDLKLTSQLSAPFRKV